VQRGLASPDADDRKRAIATAALLADRSLVATIAARATDDPDRGVRLTADAALLVLLGGDAR
jgi:hypothetical protein